MKVTAINTSTIDVDELLRIKHIGIVSTCRLIVFLASKGIRVGDANGWSETYPQTIGQALRGERDETPLGACTAVRLPPGVKR